MKEKIYTIPVTDSFREECECPVCVLEKKLEDEYVEYTLGPSLMEPDGRTLTNEQGFCRRHFEALYNKEENRLGLGLILDTHLVEQNKMVRKLYEAQTANLKKDSELTLMKDIANKVTAKQTESQKFVDTLVAGLTELEGKCAVCAKLDKTMDRYLDVILYLYFNEPDFKALFNSKKGFCMKHFRFLLQGSRKYLNAKETAIFVDNLLRLQLENMDRIQGEVNWFTKKFDYRNQEEPWGNSRDALPRSIQKITGFCRLNQ